MRLHLVLPCVESTAITLGLECLSILGRSCPDLKVCMLTALQEQELLNQLSGYGAVDCLAKPVDPRRLLHKVHKWCALPA